MNGKGEETIADFVNCLEVCPNLIHEFARCLALLNPNSDSLSAVQESGPSYGTLTLNPDGSFDYLPETNYYGFVTFTYHVTDGLLISNPATVTITVNNVNDSPLANNDAYSTPKNTVLSVVSPGVLLNDSDQDDDPLVAVLESLPSSGSLNLNPNGSFEYLPEKDFCGLVYFDYRASDGLVLSDIATASIMVGPPVAVDDYYKTPKNTVLTIGWPGVLRNDRNPDGGVLSANLESEPSKGSLSLNPGGDFTYMPKKDYIGLVTFTYKAQSGELVSNIATVTIAVGKAGNEIYLPMLIR